MKSGGHIPVLSRCGPVAVQFHPEADKGIPLLWISDRAIISSKMVGRWPKLSRKILINANVTSRAMKRRLMHRSGHDVVRGVINELVLSRNLLEMA